MVAGMKKQITTFQNIDGQWVAALNKNGAIYEIGATEKEAVKKLKENRKKSK